MDKATFEKNLAIVKDNQQRIETLEKSMVKKERLEAYLLSGRPVTGAIMIALFNIFSYRDAIYSLKKDGYNIKDKRVYADNGVEHRLWWLGCFDEEFILAREAKIF